jgi:hypothetical protein
LDELWKNKKASIHEEQQDGFYQLSREHLDHMGKLQLLNAQERATKRQTKRGFFKRSYQDGLNTICIYDDMGADFVMTIGAAEICPL